MSKPRIYRGHGRRPARLLTRKTRPMNSSPPLAVGSPLAELQADTAADRRWRRWLLSRAIIWGAVLLALFALAVFTAAVPVPDEGPSAVELCAPWPVSPAAVGLFQPHEWTCMFPNGCTARLKDPKTGLWTMGHFRKGDMISGCSKDCAVPYGWGWRCCVEQSPKSRRPCHWTHG